MQPPPTPLIAPAPDDMRSFAWRVTACHMLSYFAIGWLASSVLQYRELFGSDTEPSTGAWRYMRSFDSPWVAAGPMLQVLRGGLLSAALWPLRSLWVVHEHGGWLMWLLLCALLILGPAAAAPGSLEGVIYTRLSWADHLLGWPEMGAQTLAFSSLVRAWYRRPSPRWNLLIGAGVGLVCVFSTLGVLAALYPCAFR